MIFLREDEAAAETEEQSGAGDGTGPVAAPHARGASPWWRTGSRILLGAGVVLVTFVAFEFTASALLYQRSQVALLQTFKDEIPATNLDDPAATVAEASPVAIIDIPKIRVDEVVVEGTSPDDLKLGPGHLSGTPLPGEFGNAVLAGRRSTYGGPFERLGELTKGNLIVVTTGQGRFEYVVSSVQRVPAGVASPLQGTLDNRLTLVTSDPELYPTGRLVVTATLQGNAESIATRPDIPVTADATGLSGNFLGVGLALVWGQLLGAAVWGGFRLRRRLPLSLTLMFAVPVVLTLGVLVFTSLDLALPATL